MMCILKNLYRGVKKDVKEEARSKKHIYTVSDIYQAAP